MAISRIGLKNAKLSDGESPRGQKVFLVSSDTKISDNIDLILDASSGSYAIPAYNDVWSIDTTAIRVRDKQASALDMESETQEGFHWKVTVDYATTDKSQRAASPQDRDWEWSKTPDRRDIYIAASTFDTSGYESPMVGVGNNVNLSQGEGFTNTAGEVIAEGAPRTVSRQVIRLTKYIDDPSDIGLGVGDWSALDAYQDKVNSDSITILNVSYEKWELLMDAVSYESVTEDGVDTVRVTFNIIVDTEYKHVFSYPSTGYNQVVDGKLVEIKNDNGEPVNSPQLLDDTGALIPPPGPAAFIKEPFVISGGVNALATFSTIDLPSAIP